ncbi:phosphatase PAP2 family protein [Flaviaesturariibacter amylovorans]|uniref:Phosphatidic acid phosphatase type 2/haloperoxidase domain-containing protein n=1 Tax=Flaviaesturariibacter amylovorans TaxID=1084520 RepID=A0ABP8HNG9_9BACT
MKKNLLLLLLLAGLQASAQVEPTAGTWKTWFLPSARALRLPAPPTGTREIDTVLAAQRALDAEGYQQVQYWTAGAPNFRWHSLLGKLWTTDTGSRGVLAQMLLATSIYDATIAAWDSKYAHRRPRPFSADRRIRVLGPRPESPSWPCEHSVAAGAAVAIFARFYPQLADSVERMAARSLAARIASGTAFPSDTRAGFALGKRVAEEAIARTAGYLPAGGWDGQRPAGPGVWNGKWPMLVMAAKARPVVLDSASQLRPGPPPDFAKDMAELRSYKQSFRSRANAFYYATQNFTDELLHQKLFEYNLLLNPPRAARIYAATAVATYDTFIACWDAKYAYWGMRPEQYDTTYQPLMPAPPFPGYPSGHAAMGGMVSGLYSYFFPAEKALFEKKAKDGAESRFQAGIHFRTDNEAGLELGRRVADAVLRRVQADGADRTPLWAGR